IFADIGQFLNKPVCINQSPEAGPGFATLDAVTGRLVIPELIVDGNVAYRNVVFMLTDLGQLLFTLLSYE
ncbi:MAG: hypothetical protein OXE78_00875, partial [Gammaproteobacteria bacterium]|nr:hypothetical protein [Gammaproteobacteria bacterium]